jgi:hypothetical protein
VGGASAEPFDRDGGVRVPVDVSLSAEEQGLLADQEHVVSASSQRRDHFDAMTAGAAASIPLRSEDAPT